MKHKRIRPRYVNHCHDRAQNRLQEILSRKRSKTDNQSWLISYLDIITLLLALFILFVINPQEEYQVEKPEIQTENVQTIPVEKPTPTLNHELADQIIKSLDIIEGQDIAIKTEPGRVSLQLPASILFDTGKARLIDAADDVLKKLVPVLKQNPWPIAVEGHTDNVPIQSPRFPSNWELSAARASSVIRKLNQLGIPKNRMKAIGYADTHPIANNLTAEGRKANRRVSLVILADTEVR